MAAVTIRKSNVHSDDRSDNGLEDLFHMILGERMFSNVLYGVRLMEPRVLVVRFRS